MLPNIKMSGEYLFGGNNPKVSKLNVQSIIDAEIIKSELSEDGNTFLMHIDHRNQTYYLLLDIGSFPETQETGLSSSINLSDTNFESYLLRRLTERLSAFRLYQDKQLTKAVEITSLDKLEQIEELFSKASLAYNNFAHQFTAIPQQLSTAYKNIDSFLTDIEEANASQYIEEAKQSMRPVNKKGQTILPSSRRKKHQSKHMPPTSSQPSEEKVKLQQSPFTKVLRKISKETVKVLFDKGQEQEKEKPKKIKFEFPLLNRDKKKDKNKE